MARKWKVFEFEKLESKQATRGEFDGLPLKKKLLLFKERSHDDEPLKNGRAHELTLANLPPSLFWPFGGLEVDDEVKPSSSSELKGSNHQSNPFLYPSRSTLPTNPLRLCPMDWGSPSKISHTQSSHTEDSKD